MIKTKCNFRVMARIKDLPQSMAAEMRKTKSASMSASVEGESKKFFSFQKFGKILFVLVFIGALGASSYYYYQYRKLTKNDQTAEINSLVKDLNKVIDLPSDETPTLATVTDKEKLANQPFFKNAANDDKVLIYVKAGKAILYRPSTHKIVDVSTVNITNDQQSVPTTENANTVSSSSNSTTSNTSATPATDGKPSIALYNGAKTLGLTYKVEDQISKSFTGANFTKKQPAAKTDYVKTIVVDVSGKYSSMAGDMARNLSADLKPLPDGEAAPDSDILIIVGEDKAR